MPSVLKTTYDNHEIIIADNGSTDDSISFLEKAYPAIQLIDLQENTGFAEGYNRALKNVESDYIVLLNSDVEVTPNWLDPIIEMMEHDATIAACQPKVLAYDKRDVFEYAGGAGGFMDKWGYPFCRGRIFDFCETDKGQYDTPIEITWATGAALVIRKEIFKQLEGFDGDYFAHSEEIDLCWRIKRAGYKIMCQPASVVYHVGGGTLAYNSTRKTYLNFRNSLYTIYKNESAGKLFWLLPLRLILDGAAGLKFLTEGKFTHIWAIIRAHWTFIPNILKLQKKKEHYSQLIENIKIDQPNTKGFYNKSIVWQYYFSKHKKYADLSGKCQSEIENN